jgi:hypothetical protein
LNSALILPPSQFLLKSSGRNLRDLNWSRGFMGVVS